MSSSLKPSGAANKYRMELLAEWVTGMASDDAGSAFMERGTEMEEDARNWLAFQMDTDIRQVGFVTNDAGTIGASPDGLIGDDKSVEIKCPSMKVHLAYLLHGPDADYRLQCQGQLWIAERDVSVFISYNPVVKPRVIETPRNDAVIDALATHVRQFVDDLHWDKARLRDMGVVPASERPKVTSLADAEGVTDEVADMMFDSMSD